MKQLRIVTALCAFSFFTAQVKAEDADAARVEYRSMLDVPLIATSGKEVDFIDKRWVEHTYFLTRHYNNPEKLPDAVLHHENINYPLAASGTVLRNDDGSLGFYYQTTPRHRPWAGIAEDAPASLRKKWAKTGGLYRYYLHYASSTNGVNWEIPSNSRPSRNAGVSGVAC